MKCNVCNKNLYKVAKNICKLCNTDIVECCNTCYDKFHTQTHTHLKGVCSSCLYINDIDDLDVYDEVEYVNVFRYYCNPRNKHYVNDIREIQKKYEEYLYEQKNKTEIHILQLTNTIQEFKDNGDIAYFALEQYLYHATYQLRELKTELSELFD